MSDTPELDKMAAALRDAERYRWLRQNYLPDLSWILEAESQDEFCTAAEADAAIDKAMNPDSRRFSRLQYADRKSCGGSGAESARERGKCPSRYVIMG